MVTPLTLTDPFTSTWYHGTHTEPFTSWKCPPPARSPADVPHTGVFFTADRGYAKAAGDNVCTVTLNKGAKLIAPAHPGAASTALRKAVMNSQPLAAHCQWMTSDALWATAWSTGEVLRFAYDTSDRKAVFDIAKALTAITMNLKKIVITPLPDELLMKQAMMCLTRGWIEHLVLEAKKLGYQAIQGAEIDRWTAPGSAPIAQPWLAVTDASVVTAPAWL